MKSQPILLLTPDEPPDVTWSLVCGILLLAIKEKASEVRFEPTADDYLLTCRIEGIEYEWGPLPRHLKSRISQIIKEIAYLEISELERAQDGSFRVTIRTSTTDVGVSIRPGAYGDCVILSLSNSTVTPDQAEYLRKAWGMSAEGMSVDQLIESFEKDDAVQQPK